MFNILVTGSNGQLGSEIRTISTEFADRVQFFFVTRADLNLEAEGEVDSFVTTNRIHGIINAAAYTAVDLAEKEVEKAHLANTFIPELLSKISKRNNLRYLHVSTDFVFDGRSYLPYKEQDLTNPLSVYGGSKEKGEKAVLATDNHSLILRTSWVYSKFGNNFLKTIRRLATERPELRIIFDQIGSPTWARDLARVSIQLLLSKEIGIFHFSNEGVASWYDFAKEILELSHLTTKILPIETSEYPTPAIRPAYSLLNKAKIKQSLNIDIPHWKSSLKDCISEMN